MSGLTHRNFGLLIAYVLPGFVVLAGASLVSPVAKTWLISARDTTGPSVGGFLNAFLFSVAAGVTASAIRWCVLDRIHQLTGVRRPRLDLANLEGRLQAFERVVEDHYRYYEFYGGMLVAALFSYTLWRVQQAGMGVGIYDFLFLAIEVVFAVASRDALRNYYGRAARVLGTVDSEAPMTNGSGHHEQGSTGTSRKTPTEKPPPAKKDGPPSGEATKTDKDGTTRKE